ncbi:MAG: hypothetical protein AAB972_00670, partial [Patescibacteria group bacterium]
MESPHSIHNSKRLPPTRTWAGLSVLVITFIIFAFPRAVNDPDFGWHLKAGQLYSETRHVPTHDVFSYTMKDYAWVNHEYAIDAFYYTLYRLGQETTILLSLFFLALGIITFLIVFPRTFPYALHADERLFAGLIALLISRVFFGIRSQVFDWLGLLLVILIWNRYKQTKSCRTLCWYIPLFFLWANIHGGFFIGLAVLGFLFCFDGIDQLMSGTFSLWIKKEKYRLLSALGIIMLAGISTLLNPYGIHLHQDIIRTLTQNSAMAKNIQEWQPSIVSAAIVLPFTIYIFSLIFLLMRHKCAFTFRDAMLVIIFLFFALSSLRFIPFFILISLPFFAGAFSKQEFFLPMLLFVILPGFFLSVIYGSAAPIRTNTTPLVAPSPVSLDSQRHTFYSQVPTQALAHLRTYPMQGNMFNDYDWGGTIIWSFPEYKVFIDGRMPYWQLNGRNIFKDYLVI